MTYFVGIEQWKLHTIRTPYLCIPYKIDRVSFASTICDCKTLSIPIFGRIRTQIMLFDSTTVVHDRFRNTGIWPRQWSVGEFGTEFYPNVLTSNRCGVDFLGYVARAPEKI